MGGLFNFTRKMQFQEAFAVAAVVVAAFAVFFLVAIRDPDLNKLRRGMDAKL